MVRIKTCKKRIYILILALVIMAEFFLLSLNQCFAKDMSYNNSENIETIINDCFDLLSGDGMYVLSGDLLASAGSTGGDWFAVGCGQYKKDDAYNDYLSALESYVTECYGNNSYGLSRNKATEWHRVSLAVLACGGNPLAFGEDSKGNPINLIADGTYNCVIGTPWKQGINGAAYALISLDSMEYDIPKDALYTRNDCIEYILSKELSGGGFALRGNTADVDITAMVLTALSPYYDTYSDVKAAIDRGLDALSGMQLAEGYFAYGGAPAAESTAQVLVTLTSLDIDIWSDKRFITEEGNTVLDGLLEFYNSDEKGFSHIKGESINMMADSQCIYALVSLYRQLNDMGRLFDFTKKETAFNTKEPPEKTSIPQVNATFTPHTEAPKYTKEPQYTNEPQYTKAPYQNVIYTNTPNPPNNIVPKQDILKMPKASGAPQIKVTKTVTRKTIKSKDKVIKRKGAYVNKKELKSIYGTIHNIKIITCTDEGKYYSVVFHGDNVSEIKKEYFNLSSKSKYNKKIHKISDNSYVLNLKHKNRSTGNILIETYADLNDGEYLLMRFDEKSRNPEYIDKVSVKDNRVHFITDSQGIYFLAKSVKISKEETDDEVQETAYDNVNANADANDVSSEAVLSSDIDRHPTEDKAVYKDNMQFTVIVVCVVLFAAVCMILTLFIYKRRKK